GLVPSPLSLSSEPLLLEPLALEPAPGPLPPLPISPASPDFGICNLPVSEVAATEPLLTLPFAWLGAGSGAISVCMRTTAKLPVTSVLGTVFGISGGSVTALITIAVWLAATAASGESTGTGALLGSSGADPETTVIN